MQIRQFMLLILLTPLAQAQLPGVVDIQLSNPQHAGADVDATSLFFSPDGRYVCFIGDTETENADELWCADTAAGLPAVRVSGLLPSGAGVQRPAFSDDSDLIFYVAPGPQSDRNDLFMVEPDGSSPPVRLNAALQPAGVSVGRFRYLPLTRQVVYLADSLIAGQSRLHIVSIDDPEIVTILNGPLVAGGEVDSFEVAPQSERVVYLADQQSQGVQELYSVRFNGAGAAKLNGSLVGGGDVFSFQVASDGSRVAYRADQDSDNVQELYVSDIGGGGSTKVSGTAVTGGDARFYFFSPDSQWLLFSGDLATNGWRDLYSTPADGSQQTPNVIATQTQEAPKPPGIELIPDIVVTTDGNQVLFLSRQGTVSSRRALRAPIDGSSPAIVLSGGLTAVDSLQYLPASDRILIRTGGPSENYYSIAVDGSSFIPLTSFSGPDIDVIGSSTPQGLVYYADPDIDSEFSVYLVDYQGQATRELTSGDEFFEGLASPIRFSSDLGAVYFVENRGSFSPLFSSYRLRMVDLDSLASLDLAVISNNTLGDETEFLSFRVNPRNRNQLVYAADREADEQADAYLVTLSDMVFGDRFN